jgi:threonine dehydratase
LPPADQPPADQPPADQRPADRPRARVAAAVTRSAIAETAELIRPYVRRTPVIILDGADLGLAAGEIVLKLEQLQHSGSFKARGAFTNLLRREVPPAGVIAASGGNHGAAVAYAAGVLGVPARIFVPEVSSAAKISRIRCCGAGQVRIVGAEPAGAPTLTRAFEAGQPVDAPVGSVAIDSLAPRRVGDLTFAVISRYSGSVVLVSDEAILRAQWLLWDRLRLVAEPGGCAALAALLSGQYVPGPGEVVAVVISGANTTAVDFSR